MRARDAERADSDAFDNDVLRAVGEEAFGPVPLLTVGFHADAPVHEEVDVPGPRHLELGLHAESRIQK